VVDERFTRPDAMQSLINHPRLMDCRRLFLRNYEVWINIGVHDFEKRGEQRVLINVDLYIPLALSTPVADRLEEVVDYDFIRRSVMERVSLGHIHLQETLADDVLALMLAHPRVRAARVSTAKPDVYPDCDAVGVEVFGIKEATP
jgi:dihydroneopterin aldolase